MYADSMFIRKRDTDPRYPGWVHPNEFRPGAPCFRGSPTQMGLPDSVPFRAIEECGRSQGDAGCRVWRLASPSRVLDARTGAELCRLDHGGPVSAVVFSPDGGRVATGSRDRSARVLDVVTGAQLCRLDHDGAVFAVAFSGDGSRIATSSQDRSARVLDAISGAELSRMDHSSSVSSVTFSPSGRLVATGSNDGSARVSIHGVG